MSIDTFHKLEATKKQLNFSVDFKFPAKVTCLRGFFYIRLDLSIDTILKLGATKKQLNYSVDFKFPAKVDLSFILDQTCQ